MATQLENKAKRNGKPDRLTRDSLAGVVKFVGQSQLPQEFITIGKDFEEALGRAVLRDDKQRSDIIILKAQYELFEMWDEIRDLTAWLNGSGAVGGFNRSLAAMTYTGVYVPEGAGIKISKENQKALMELQKQRAVNQSEADKQKDRDKGPA